MPEDFFDEAAFTELMNKLRQQSFDNAARASDTLLLADIRMGLTIYFSMVYLFTILAVITT